MTNPRARPPSANEIEVSILGPGFGECVLAHVGAGRWIIIDSCIDTATGRSAALSYLSEIGVPASAVELIVATHWHDDHVRGMSSLVEACDSAQFCCSAALQRNEFFALANLYSRAPVSLPAGPTELGAVFLSILERKGTSAYRPIKWAQCDTPLWNATVPLGDRSLLLRITALSPSDEMLTRAFAELAHALEACRISERLTLLTPGHPNHVAVAMRLDVGDWRILLGSDLEETGDPLIGWSAVLSSVGLPQGTASVYKVAHHGSVSGHCDRLWSDMLERNPLSVLTPFRWGRHRLPNATDRARILALTQRAFITAHPERDLSPKKRLVKVEQFINATAKRRSLAAGPLGHIRWRAPLMDPNHPGTIELFHEAMDLAEVA